MMLTNSPARVGISCLLLALLLITTSACLSTSSYHTARTIEAGTTEMGLALEGHGSIDDDDDGGLFVPQPKVFARRGLTDQSDLGFAGGYFGTEIDYNHMVYDSESVALSINPRLGLQWEAVIGSDDEDSTLVWTPILGIFADYRIAPPATITLGLKPGVIGRSVFGADDSESDSSFFFAGSLGARFDAESFFLFPEFNLIFPFDDQVDGPLWSIGLGVGF